MAEFQRCYFILPYAVMNSQIMPPEAPEQN